MKNTSARPSAILMMWRAGRMIGAPLMRPDSFSERDHRSGEGQRADGDAERHFDQARAVDVAGRADVERFRRVERTGGDQHRGHADQRVERGDQFGHRGHRHLAGDHGADAAADGDRRESTSSQARPSAGGWLASVVATAMRHAGHAEEIALPAEVAGLDSPRSDRMKRYARDEIQNCGEIGVHLRSVPRAFHDKLISSKHARVLAMLATHLATSFSSGTSPACAASPESRRKYSRMRRSAR